MDIDLIKIRRLDLTILIILRDLMRYRKTTVVADRLGLSQSAVSHALARLRDIFDEPLFTRRPDGMEPTARALALLPIIDQVLDLLQGAVNGEADFIPEQSTKTFRIGTNDYIASLLSSPLMAHLARHAPKTRLIVEFAVGTSSLDRLRRHEIDLAIGRVDAAPEDITRYPLFDETFVTILRKDHPLHSHPFDLATYLAQDHVLVSFQGGFSGSVDQALANLGTKRRVVASVPMFMTAFALVAETDLIATVPTRLARKHAALFGLVIRPTPLAIPDFSIMAFRHATSSGDKAIDWLLDLVRNLAFDVDYRTHSL